MKQHGKNTIQAGDDIYNKLFADQFKRVYPSYHSLNAYDIKKNDELASDNCYNNMFQ